MGWHDTTEAWLEKLKENPDLAAKNRGLKILLGGNLSEAVEKRQGVDSLGMKLLTEEQFATQVEALLDLGKWCWIHIRPARVLRHGKETYETPYSGHKGFLDYLCLRPPRIVVMELKGQKGKLSPEQKIWFALWLTLSKLCPLVEVYLFRPSQIDEVISTLR